MKRNTAFLLMLISSGVAAITFAAIGNTTACAIILACVVYLFCKVIERIEP